MRIRVFVALFVLLSVGWFVSPAAQTLVVSYDIAYVRSPRSTTAPSPFADVFKPFYVAPDSDLILRHPNGTEIVLVDAAPMGAVADPCVSFDGRTIYYAYNPDVVTGANVQGVPPRASFDIWKVVVATGAKTQLTHSEYTPNTGVRTAPLLYGVQNMGACPVNTSEGTKIVFTSNRNGFVPPRGYTPVTMQLYVMNEDGSNVHFIGPLTLSSALHPVQLMDGRVMFSSQEDQGLRDQRIWALWGIWPDGREWQPIDSGFGDSIAKHFATERSDGSKVVEYYYNFSNFGFGTFVQIPAPNSTSTVGFFPAFTAQNPDLLQYREQNGVALTYRIPFTPTGAFTLTPFSTFTDEASGLRVTGSGPTGARYGKVSQPSGAPGNDLLMAWSDGPVNGLQRPTSLPLVDAGIYLDRKSVV